MKKLLLGAMLAAACITTNVDAGILGIRTKGDKAEVDTILREYAGENYEARSTRIVNGIKALTKEINEFKKSQDKTTKKTLDGISKESKKISEFFKFMKEKKSRTNIAKKGEKATQAAVALKGSLERWSESKSPAWLSFKDKFKNSIPRIADEVVNLANETNEGTYTTKKGKGIELNIKALLTSLSTSFESIRGLFADEPSSVGTDQNQPNNENLLNNNAGNGENTDQNQFGNGAPLDNNGGNANTIQNNEDADKGDASSVTSKKRRGRGKK